MTRLEPVRNRSLWTDSDSDAAAMPAYYRVDSSSDRIPLHIVRKETPLSPSEKQYLLAVERGDFGSVRQFLEEAEIYFNININCVDPLGRTALMIAIQNENIEVTELLLRHNIHVGDALLHAIDEEVVEAVELILKQKPLSKKDIRVRMLQTEGLESDFTADISPVMLAAHRNNYEILKLLLERGATIPKPHDVKCGCDDCISSIKHDGLRHSRSRLNIYKALASPSLIALSSEDPILTAFELSGELRRLSKLENEFKEDYEVLVEQCKEFATLLLDQTRGSQELAIILNRDADSPTGVEPLSRLKLAIKYKQKAFTAHPSCQQLLAEVWYRGLPGWRRQHWALKIMISCFIGLSYPMLCIMYLLFPCHKIGQLLRLPFLKFLCHSSAYLLFLVLLILASLDVGGAYAEKRTNTRGPAPTDVEVMILVWIFGYIWAEVKELWNNGLIEYMGDWWNILDFMTNSLYMGVIGLRVTAYCLKTFKADLYPSKCEREFWSAWDPTLISEAMFAVANILSMLRLVYFFTANSHLGPLQISLGRMVEDILKFMCLIVLALFSFSAGLNQLYLYYKTDGVEGCFGIMCENQNNAFTQLFQALQALVWAVFGLVSLEVLKVEPEHYVTEFVGAWMLGVYCITTIIVLVNLLIAMMNTSFQHIVEKTDENWKFARSRTWISYFDESGSLPPPFNIIPSPKTIYYILRWLKRKACSLTVKRNSEKDIRKNVLKRRENDENYQKVVRNLVKRYLKFMKRGQQQTGVSEDDLNEIKVDISAFRYEMLEILKSKGFSTPQDSKSLHTPLSGPKGGKNPTSSSWSSSVSMVSSVDSIPDYLLGSGHRPKKTKRSPQHRDSLHKPLKTDPIQDEDYALPDFLKVKNVKNVIGAVNELRKATSMRRRMSEAAMKSKSMAVDRIEEEETEITTPPTPPPQTTASTVTPPVPNPKPHQHARRKNGSNVAPVPVKPPTPPPKPTLTAKHAEPVNGQVDDRETKADVIQLEDISSASWKREKTFANRNDISLDTDDLPEQPSLNPSPEAGGESQSTSGFGSHNNSFQSQDSVEDEDQENKLMDSEFNDNELNTRKHKGAYPLLDIPKDELGLPKVKWPPTRSSFLWGNSTKTQNDDEQVTRFFSSEETRDKIEVTSFSSLTPVVLTSRTEDTRKWVEGERQCFLLNQLTLQITHAITVSK
ncbi:short transient receptor potential channel 4-like isoform X2 [Anneissia japonica]|uniref:short transient receptor potential channel 4-like isoform X2 n=1 Tax=Anneissia japonica TaxID=1529436 RepID=UPI001425ACFB|nr:short transient receptor potential channel 4-like isoform X2 [Anneissia japonica]